MTYLELYESATWNLEHGVITLGEWEKTIEPLKQEVRQKTAYWKTERINHAQRGWIELQRCSRCDGAISASKAGLNYCPCCGAKMIEVGESE